MNAEAKMSWANKFLIALVVGGVAVIGVFLWIFGNIARYVWGF